MEPEPQENENENENEELFCMNDENDEDIDYVNNGSLSF